MEIILEVGKSGRFFIPFFTDIVLQVQIVIGTPDAVFLSVQIKYLGCGLQMRTFDMVAMAYLGDLTIEQPQYKSLIPGRNTLFVIDNTHNTDQNLLQFKYIQVSISYIRNFLLTVIVFIQNTIALNKLLI